MVQMVGASHPYAAKRRGRAGAEAGGIGAYVPAHSFVKCVLLVWVLPLIPCWPEAESLRSESKSAVVGSAQSKCLYLFRAGGQFPFVALKLWNRSSSNETLPHALVSFLDSWRFNEKMVLLPYLFKKYVFWNIPLSKYMYCIKVLLILMNNCFL